MLKPDKGLELGELAARLLEKGHMSKVEKKQERSLPSDHAGGPLPFPATCRARAVGSITDFAECLVEQPVSCVHGLLFGGARFCWHPRRQDIVARTAAS